MEACIVTDMRQIGTIDPDNVGQKDTMLACASIHSVAHRSLPFEGRGAGLKRRTRLDAMTASF
jgi:hypothetical protein